MLNKNMNKWCSHHFVTGFQIQMDKMEMANQPDIVVVDKQKKTAVVIDIAC